MLTEEGKAFLRQMCANCRVSPFYPTLSRLAAAGRYSWVKQRIKGKNQSKK